MKLDDKYFFDGQYYRRKDGEEDSSAEVRRLRKKIKERLNYTYLHNYDLINVSKDSEKNLVMLTFETPPRLDNPDAFLKEAGNNLLIANKKRGLSPIAFEKIHFIYHKEYSCFSRDVRQKGEQVRFKAIELDFNPEEAKCTSRRFQNHIANKIKSKVIKPEDRVFLEAIQIELMSGKIVLTSKNALLPIEIVIQQVLKKEMPRGINIEGLSSQTNNQQRDIEVIDTYQVSEDSASEEDEERVIAMNSVLSASPSSEESNEERSPEINNNFIMEEFNDYYIRLMTEQWRRDFASINEPAIQENAPVVNSNEEILTEGNYSGVTFDNHNNNASETTQVTNVTVEQEPNSQQDIFDNVTNNNVQPLSPEVSVLGSIQAFHRDRVVVTLGSVINSSAVVCVAVGQHILLYPNRCLLKDIDDEISKKRDNLFFANDFISLTQMNNMLVLDLKTDSATDNNTIEKFNSYFPRAKVFKQLDCEFQDTLFYHQYPKEKGSIEVAWMGTTSDFKAIIKDRIASGLQEYFAVDETEPTSAFSGSFMFNLQDKATSLKKTKSIVDLFKKLLSESGFQELFTQIYRNENPLPAYGYRKKRRV